MRKWKGIFEVKMHKLYTSEYTIVYLNFSDFTFVTSLSLFEILIFLRFTRYTPIKMNKNYTILTNLFVPTVTHCNESITCMQYVNVCMLQTSCNKSCFYLFWELKIPCLINIPTLLLYFVWKKISSSGRYAVRLAFSYPLSTLSLSFTTIVKLAIYNSRRLIDSRLQQEVVMSYVMGNDTE